MFRFFSDSNEETENISEEIKIAADGTCDKN